MAKKFKKERREYYFSVDGETEEWYLNWLRKTINANDICQYNVSFNISVQPNPLKYAKSVVLLYSCECEGNTIKKTQLNHICDYESNDDVHVKQFLNKLNLMKTANSLNNKQIDYKLGYSNFTFELWLTLHKIDCSGGKSHRKDYLQPINKAFNESFENLSHLKNETNFTRILKKLTLDNVKDAITRAKIIMKNNITHGLVEKQYCGYNYYKENPSLSIHCIIEQILKDCGCISGNQT